ncbi:MAG: hypothetical protein ACR2NZ_06155 [Rubripirellula sp.]
MLLFLTVIWLSLFATTVIACKVPVFRYALERWNTDRYKMIVMVDDGTGDSAKESIEMLRGSDASKDANVDIEVINMDQLSEQQLWQLEDFDPDVQTPHLQVFYPEREGRRRLCWEGPMSLEVVRGWLDSPLRATLQQDLVGGASAVWLFIEGPDSDVNAEVERVVQQGLRLASDQILIPDGVIPRDGASEYIRSHPGASMDDVLRSDVPLRVDFQVRRLARSDTDEIAVRKMVTGLAASADVPLLVPIFGRGRMLDAIDASGIDSETILNACRYMVGECSCTVKTQNPGVDMLISTDWPSALGGETIVLVEAPLNATPQVIDIPSGSVVVAETERRSLFSWGAVGVSVALMSLLLCIMVWRRIV